jgi:hypothetical protein
VQVERCCGTDVARGRSLPYQAKLTLNEPVLMNALTWSDCPPMSADVQPKSPRLSRSSSLTVFDRHPFGGVAGRPAVGARRGQRSGQLPGSMMLAQLAANCEPGACIDPVGVTEVGEELVALHPEPGACIDAVGVTEFRIDLHGRSACQCIPTVTAATRCASGYLLIRRVLHPSPLSVHMASDQPERRSSVRIGRRR